MNRYEVYLSQGGVVLPYFKGQRVYTRNEAMDNAAYWPGLRGSVSERLSWLRNFPETDWFFPTAEGIRRAHSASIEWF